MEALVVLVIGVVIVVAVGGGAAGDGAGECDGDGVGCVSMCENQPAAYLYAKRMASVRERLPV